MSTTLEAVVAAAEAAGWEMIRRYGDRNGYRVAEMTKSDRGIFRVYGYSSGALRYAYMAGHLIGQVSSQDARALGREEVARITDPATVAVAVLAIAQS